jgi:hypothetical protein
MLLTEKKVLRLILDDLVKNADTTIGNSTELKEESDS